MDYSLHEAVRDGDARRITGLLKRRMFRKSPDVNGLRMGVTPLWIAVSFRKKEIVELLLAKGARHNAANADGDVPIHAAFFGGYSTAEHLQVVKALLANGADVNARSSTGTTALHRAVEFHHLDAIEYLLSVGADIDAVDRRGSRPIHLAVYECCQAEELRLGRWRGSMPCEPDTPARVVSLLAHKGADLGARNGQGKTPLEQAISKNCTDTVQLLHSLGAPAGMHQEEREDHSREFATVEGKMLLYAVKETAPPSQEDAMYMVGEMMKETLRTADLKVHVERCTYDQLFELGQTLGRRRQLDRLETIMLEVLAHAGNHLRQGAGEFAFSCVWLWRSSETQNLPNMGLLGISVER